MDYLNVNEMSKKWNLSVRSVRNYCATGRIPNCIRQGKTWLIPSDAIKPTRIVKNGSNINQNNLKMVLKEEKANHRQGGVYHKIQVDLTYNSNHIEGSKLTHDETRYIFETNTIGIENKCIKVDDIIETVNHFRCIDLMIDKMNTNLSENLMKQFHYLLKNGTSDSQKEWFMVGDYKKLPNEVGGVVTTLPEHVHEEMEKLLNWYHSINKITLENLLDFHCRFESIHPFQDGNGRVGRLILFKECLKNNITPFIIDEELKMFYYRGLKEWKKEKGYLMDTCLTAQDQFKKYLDYFRIKYKD